MTAPVIDLGPSWLRSLPDGVRVRRREVLLCTVTAVADGWFSARVPGEKRRRPFDLCQVGDGDRSLLVVGAKFWWLSEWTGPGEVTSAIRLRRPGISAQAAFLPDPTSPKGAS